MKWFCIFTFLLFNEVHVDITHALGARAAQKGINPLVAFSVKRMNGAHSEDRRRYERLLSVLHTHC